MSITESMTRKLVNLDKGNLEVYFKGNENDPLIIFLHGFPEYWRVWENQIEYFVKQGYFVCAPNQRGYGHSFSPSSRRHYSLDKLAQDVISIIDGLPHSQAVLVGHDWGGGVVYHLATKYKEYISRAIVLNMPHPYIGRTWVFKKFEQFKKTIYVTLYQLPFVTNWLLQRNNYKHLQSALDKSIKGNEDLVSQLKFELVDLWDSRPQNLKGMINWYRANVFYNVKDNIEIPVLILWGEQEEFILKDLADASLEFLIHEESRLDLIPNSIHACQLEQPEMVNEKINKFIS